MTTATGSITTNNIIKKKKNSKKVKMTQKDNKIIIKIIILAYLFSLYMGIRRQ